MCFESQTKGFISILPENKFMHTILKSSVFLVMTLLFAFSSPLASKKSCSILHSGTFTYKADGDVVKIKVEGENHTEYHQGGKYVIESSLDWVSDCEYNATLKNTTLPNFPFKPGEVMNVKIDKVKGKNIYITAKIRGKSYPNILTKIAD